MSEKAAGNSAPKKSGGSGVNKMECVKKALESLGYETRPIDLKEYIKKNFQVEMNTDHISANKSTILKKLGKSNPSGKAPAAGGISASATKPVAKSSGKKKGKRKPTPAPAAKVAAPAPAVAEKSGELNLQLEAQTIKGLVDRLGMDNLQTLIHMVAK